MTDITPLLNKIHCMDALALMAQLPDASVSLIAVDWPYNGVKDAEWDNQWPTDNAYLDWMRLHLAEMRRVLKPNGSYYGFASPRMAARVEVLTGEYFNVLNSIRWVKDAGWHNRTDKEEIRGYLQPWESVIFAEQRGSDEYASDEAGYELQCQRICQQVFQIADLCSKHNVSRADIGYLILDEYKNIESAKAQASNWILGKNIPTLSDFNKLKTVIPIQGDYTKLRQQYEDLRREYETLRNEYEMLRRPFLVSSEIPHTDVWDFTTVTPYPGKHPCEKPLDMMRHIVRASSRPGDVVLDCFCGSGVTLAAAAQLERQYIGCDRDEHWVQVARNRCAVKFGERQKSISKPLEDLPLFQNLAVENLEVTP